MEPHLGIHIFFSEVVVAYRKSYNSSCRHSSRAVADGRRGFGDCNSQAKNQARTTHKDTFILPSCFWQIQQEECCASPRATRDRRTTHPGDPERPHSRALP